MHGTLDIFNRQRSFGRVGLRFGPQGLERHSEDGSAKARMIPGSNQAMLINIGGGLAGGDDFGFDVTAGKNATVTITTQAAERCYHSLGAKARVATTLTLEQGATLYWLPQEVILYDRSKLSRSLTVDMAADAKLLLCEPVIFGRRESDEVISSLMLEERWRIHRRGRLVLAENFSIDGPLPVSPATLNNAGAMATLIMLGGDCDKAAATINDVWGKNGAASSWDGKLVARLLAKDGYELRKTLVCTLALLVDAKNLPVNWAH